MHRVQTLAVTYVQFRRAFPQMVGPESVKLGSLKRTLVILLMVEWAMPDGLLPILLCMAQLTQRMLLKHLLSKF